MPAPESSQYVVVRLGALPPTPYQGAEAPRLRLVRPHQPLDTLPPAFATWQGCKQIYTLSENPCQNSHTMPYIRATGLQRAVSSRAARRILAALLFHGKKFT